jgi:hypothetical protein
MLLPLTKILLLIVPQGNFLKNLYYHIKVMSSCLQIWAKIIHGCWQQVFEKTKRQYTIPKPFVFHNGRPSNTRASGRVDLCTGDLTSKTTTPSEPCTSTSLTIIEQHTSSITPATDVSLQNTITNGTVLGST